MPTESGTHAVCAPPPQKVSRSFRKKCSELVSKLALRGRRQSSAYEMLQQECNNEIRSTEDVELQLRFFNAASSGDKKFMKRFIGSNGLLSLLWTGPGQFNVNVQDSSNTTALMCAVRVGQLDMMRYLLFKKADPNIANKSGRTALHYAASGNNFNSNEHIVNPFIKTLLDAGADATALDMNDLTPLHLAAIFDNCSAQYTLGAKTDADIIAVMLDAKAKREKRVWEIQALEEVADEGFGEYWSPDEEEDTDVGSTYFNSTYCDFEPCEYAAGSLGSALLGPGLRASASVNGPSQVPRPETQSSSQGSDHCS